MSKTERYSDEDWVLGEDGYYYKVHKISRRKFSKNTFNRKDKGKLSKHHLIPKERVKLGTVPADEVDRNFNRLLMLWRKPHDFWHFLFRNMTLSEIIKCLQRIEHIKYGSNEKEKE